MGQLFHLTQKKNQFHYHMHNFDVYPSPLSISIYFVNNLNDLIWIGIVHKLIISKVNELKHFLFLQNN